MAIPIFSYSSSLVCTLPSRGISSCDDGGDAATTSTDSGPDPIILDPDLHPAGRTWLWLVRGGVIRIGDGRNIAFSQSGLRAHAGHAAPCRHRELPWRSPCAPATRACAAVHYRQRCHATARLCGRAGPRCASGQVEACWAMLCGHMVDRAKALGARPA